MNLSNNRHFKMLGDLLEVNPLTNTINMILICLDNKVVYKLKPSNKKITKLLRVKITKIWWLEINNRINRTSNNKINKIDNRLLNKLVNRTTNRTISKLTNRILNRTINKEWIKQHKDKQQFKPIKVRITLLIHNKINKQTTNKLRVICKWQLLDYNLAIKIPLDNKTKWVNKDNKIKWANKPNKTSEVKVLLIEQ